MRTFLLLAGAMLAIVTSFVSAADLKKSESDALAAKLKTLENYPLCLEAGRASRSTDPSPRAQEWAKMVIAKVKSTGWVDDKDVTYIRERKVYIGMHSCAAYAALGRPWRTSATTYPQGRVVQWMYEREGSNRYLHFLDDRLSSFDD